MVYLNNCRLMKGRGTKIRICGVAKRQPQNSSNQCSFFGCHSWLTPKVGPWNYKLCTHIAGRLAHLSLFYTNLSLAGGQHRGLCSQPDSRRSFSRFLQPPVPVDQWWPNIQVMLAHFQGILWKLNPRGSRAELVLSRRAWLWEQETRSCHWGVVEPIHEGLIM